MKTYTMLLKKIELLAKRAEMLTTMGGTAPGLLKIAIMLTTEYGDQAKIKHPV